MSGFVELGLEIYWAGASEGTDASHFRCAGNSKESSLCCGLSALLVWDPDGIQRVDVNANEKRE